MAKVLAADLRKRVLAGIRSYGISLALYRRAVAEKLGLSMAEMEALGLLFQTGQSSPSELGARTGLTSGATTAMLDRLEGRGLIRRLPNPKDRRGTLIVPDKDGQERVRASFNSARRIQEELVKGYGEAELQALADFLERASALMDEDRSRFQAGNEVA